MSFNDWQLSTISYDFMLHAATYWVFSIYLPKTHPHISACLLSSAFPILLPSPSVAWPFSASACAATCSQDKVSRLSYLLVLGVGNLFQNYFIFFPKQKMNQISSPVFSQVNLCCITTFFLFWRNLVGELVLLGHMNSPKVNQLFWGGGEGCFFFLGVVWKLSDSFTRHRVHLYLCKTNQYRDNWENSGTTAISV